MKREQASVGGGAEDSESTAVDPHRKSPRTPRRPEPSPTQRALALLTRREHSRKDLLRKLQARGVAIEQAQEVTDTLEASGWQSDARFAESLLRARAGSGYGPAYIRAELGTHGLGPEQIAAVLANHEGDWIECAHDQLRRRFPLALDGDRDARRKAADFLIRRGFSMDQVRAALTTEE